MNTNNTVNTEAVESLIQVIYLSYVHWFLLLTPDGLIYYSRNYSLLICGLIGKLFKT